MAVSVKLNNGKEFPLLGLGTWQSKPGEVEIAVKTALKEGYRHIDTAFIYGNESEVGTALQESFKEGVVKREDVFVVTKLWNNMHHREDVMAAMKTSLKNLKLSYVDLYLVHWPLCFQKKVDNLFPTDENGFFLFDDVPQLETWKGMEDCVEAGLAKSIGLSNYNSQQVQHILSSCSIPPAVHQFEIHPYFQQQNLVSFCQQKGLFVTGYSCLGAPQRPWVTEKEERVLDDAVINEIATKHHKTPAQVIIRWMLQRGLSPIPKSVNTGRIKENFQVYDFELNASEMDEIKALDKGKRLIIPIKEIDGKKVELFNDGLHYPFSIAF